MTKAPRRTPRRSDALSKARIIEAAIAILDAEGEDALTFRALAARLSTGSGAIYWHVADKRALVGEAADSLIERALSGIGPGHPGKSIRAIALSLLEAIDERPWIGAQLVREPLRPANLLILENIGRQLQAMGVSPAVLFNASSALVSYILGVAAQNAANGRLAREQGVGDRSAFMEEAARRWEGLDPVIYPFVRQMASDVRMHDDREQFLAGVDFILAGIEAR